MDLIIRTLQNLEIKAHYHDLQEAAQIAAAIGASKEWSRRQSDTYFRVSQGKLKLREEEGPRAELIAYRRPVQAEAKTSEYLLYPLDNPLLLKEVLSAAMPVELVVQKIRTLYLWHNVRIHLDVVEQLGSFIEFEAVLSEKEGPKLSRKRLDYLTKQFVIKASDMIQIGYYELLNQSRLENSKLIQS